jgi:hypothetical protein
MVVVSAPSYVCWNGRGNLGVARLLDLIDDAPYGLSSIAMKLGWVRLISMIYAGLFTESEKLN